MRGKKLPYPFSPVGIRGKKGPLTTAFFGTRGKRDDISGNGNDNTDEVAAMMYLLTNDKGYNIRNHMNDGSDFEMTGECRITARRRNKINIPIWSNSS